MMILQGTPIVLITILMAMPCITLAQTSEGYIAKLATSKNIQDSIVNYANAAGQCMREGKAELSNRYARMSFQLSRKANDLAGEANSLAHIANYFHNINKLDSAKHYALASNKVYDKSGKKGTYYTYNLNTIAGYYLGAGDAKSALRYAHQQMDAAMELKDSISLSNSYTMLCAIHEMLDDRKNSIRYAEKAVEINRMVGSGFNLTVVLSNLALLYMDEQQYDKALPLLHESAAVANKGSVLKDRGTANMLIGECYTQLGNYDSAIYYLERAKKDILAINNPESKVKLWALFSSSYAHQKNYNAAIPYIDSSIAILKETRQLKPYELAVQLKSEYMANAGRYEEAYKLLQESRSINDSITNTEVQEAVAELKEKYESEKKDERIAQQIHNNRLLTGGLVIVALMATLILIQYLKQRTANATIQRQSDKLTLLMKELHHRVKNNLQIISSLLSLQSFRIKDEKASRAVREGQQRIEAMSLIHQRLYTRDNITEINIKEYISDLVDSLQSAYGFNKDSINIRLDIADQLMNVDQAIPLSLIVNELVTNAFKYAFEDNHAPELTVTLKRKDGNIVLQVLDNGKGVNIEEWRDKEGSFGKELIQTFVKQLNGYLDIVVDKGSQFTLSIPYTA
jgi:two-component sensor histidine kinase